MDKGAKDKLAGSPGENGGGQDAQKDLHSRTGRNETKRKTQERMERRSGKRSLSAGSEKMERVVDRQGQMERYCATGQSPQRVVEEEEDKGRGGRGGKGGRRGGRRGGERRGGRGRRRRRSVFRILWLNVIGNWRNRHNVQLHKLYLPPDIIRIMEERQEVEWLVNVE